MGSVNIFNGMIEEKLLNLRTAYIERCCLLTAPAPPFSLWV